MLTLTPAPVSVDVLKPEHLHQHWEFIERGLSDIVRKVGPDWIPADIYSAIRTGHALAYMVSRETRRLGFFVIYRNVLPFSARVELFLWAAWTIPPRERIPADNFPEPVVSAVRAMKDIAKTWDAKWVTMITSRTGFERRDMGGFKKAFVSYRLEL